MAPLSLPSADPQPLDAGPQRTDAFHRHPLFAVTPEPGHGGGPQVVRTWQEAHALHGPARPADVNPAYVAALISDNHRADVAPYHRIRRLPRAHDVLIAPDGAIHTTPYDPLAGGAAAMEAERLHLFLRSGLVDQVRRALEGHHGPIGCEHSSGLDSNAVLGALIHGAGLPPERLHTWSFESRGEQRLLEQWRLFFRLIPTQCHRSLLQDRWLEEGDGPLLQQLLVFGAPAQIGGHPDAVAHLGPRGCTLLFSGFGGDQALSHNANNVPTDLVARGRWRELIAWMGGRRAALRVAGGRTLGLLHRPWAERRVWRHSQAFRPNDLLIRTLTVAGQTWLSPHLRPSYPWERDGYLLQRTSIRRRVLADWVAVRVEEENRLAAAHGVRKVFPLLAEDLIATLLRQDPVLFGEGPGRGRLLHRRAFAPFLPPPLRDNPTKDRHGEGALDQWRAEALGRQTGVLARGLAAADSWSPALARWWDLAAIRQEAETLLERSDSQLGAVMGTNQALATMARLSGWWHALEG
ncbi:MAG: asparagine synthase-related protein [Cyanobacteriota bacterium]|nr:asparagine synthase-related protein [Cyanobacteriota bacterium]